MATQTKQESGENNTLVKVVRGWQITLPMDMREEVGLELGSYMEAKLSNGGIFLKPVKLVSPADADRRLEDILSRVKYIGQEPMPSIDELTGELADVIRDMRREHDENSAR